MDINTALKKQLYPNIKFSDRLAFSTQLLVSRKVNNKFSVELGLINVYKNLYDDTLEQQNVFSVASGLRYKVAKRMSLNLEYAARVITSEKASDPYHNPLTLGLDIETGGHVFQLVFSNSQPMNDVAVFSGASGDWTKGKVYFGFNMYRTF
jgi:long-subunit fatty acid transport protein